MKVEDVEVSTEHWIGGERVASAQVFDDVSPIDGATIAEVARGSRREIDLAVAAAKSGFQAWGRTPPQERARVLHAIAAGIERRLPELAAVETRDAGPLLRAMQRSVVPRAAHNFHHFADHLSALEVPDFETRGHRNHVRWEPSGVVALITPWNAPLMLATWKIAPALASGAAVVLKPAEWSPLTASLLADITHEAGLPPGVFNVVQGLGEEAGAALVRHPDVDRISFTGSTQTARSIAAAAARNLTPLSFELGGKSPFLVFDDADLELAVTHAVGQYDHAGQVCLAATRLLVHRRLYDAFLARFLERARALRQGDPRDPATDIGPQIAREHVARIDRFVQTAIGRGARVALGGGPNEELGGLHYRPTLFVDVPDGAEILQEEVFGPVLTLQPFDDDEEAIALANGTRYGLAAAIFTQDRARAERVSQRIVAGTIWVNCFFVRDLRAPFGGARQSGVGREGGNWSFDFYADVKNVCTAPWNDGAGGS
ncbi:aldehyde dehydrogenase [Pendulispora rubella]|uniref:Aldehyde dehydrogenase n=1 Tax=Pendulispora rubella TaxID=2741070 RepID=A0ABZ2L0D4_9BACT